MVFQCQRNCYKKQFDTCVTASENKETKWQISSGGTKREIKGFEIIFQDTIFFPEGGGQPYDVGTVNEVAVLKVIRRKNEAVHYLEKPLEVGRRVTQTIDWTRRFDHMQQHSAQHLITAIADKTFGYATLSWNLGEQLSFIELDTPKLDETQQNDVEDHVNALIRNAVPVITKEYEAHDEELKRVRTRGIPDDVEGPVRVVTIEDVDSNMCCGTHVENLSELQSIKLLYTQKAKNNKTQLYFVAGNRVLRYLSECVEREKALNILLHTNPKDHIEMVAKLQNKLKQTTRSVNEAFKELAVLHSIEFRSIEPKPKVWFHHKRDGDSDYLKMVVNQINEENVLKILTCGEESGPAILLMQGPQEMIKQVADKVCEILEGKGGGKTRFTAKVYNLSRRLEMEKCVKTAFGIKL